LEKDVLRSTVIAALGAMLLAFSAADLLSFITG
jgi:hypothetical protein